MQITICDHPSGDSLCDCLACRCARLAAENREIRAAQCQRTIEIHITVAAGRILAHAHDLTEDTRIDGPQADITPPPVNCKLHD